MLAAMAAGAGGSGPAQTGTVATPQSRPVTAAGQPATPAADQERNPSNSAHLEGVQGGFFSMKKPLEGRASGYTCSDSAVAAAALPAAARDTKTTAEAAAESRVEQEIAVLKARIDQLEKEIKEERTGAAEGASDAAALSAAGRELVDGSRAAGNYTPAVGTRFLRQRPGLPGSADGGDARDANLARSPRARVLRLGLDLAQRQPAQ